MIVNMKHGLIGLLVAFVVFVGCNSTPEGVLSPEEMASLLVDIHKGECIVEANHSEYIDDSMKMALKQSIYYKHNVTAEQVDSSFMWYGQHIEEYIKVYDRTIEMLEDEIAQVKVSADDVEMIVVGDSADAWPGVRQRLLTHSFPNNYVTFALNRDDNWEKGDIYEWRLKLINNRTPMNCTIAVDYSDGSSEYTTLQASAEGWHDIMIVADSSKVASRIYGVAYVDLKDHEQVYIDSISLVRTRITPRLYQRRYNQNRFYYGPRPKSK